MSSFCTLFQLSNSAHSGSGSRETITEEEWQKSLANVPVNKEYVARSPLPRATAAFARANASPPFRAVT